MTTEEQERAPETAVDPSPPPPQKKPNHEGRSELIKFGILVLVFLGVIVVVAASRSLIFDRMLPAIVQPASSETGVGGVQEVPTAVSPEAENSETVEENTLFIPAAAAGEGGSAQTEETGAEPAAETPATEPTAPPSEAESAPSPVIHTVQPGDTLTNIAQRYNVPVQALMEANNLINPNYIQVGQQLVIPPAP